MSSKFPKFLKNFAKSRYMGSCKFKLHIIIKTKKFANHCIKIEVKLKRKIIRMAFKL